MPGDAGFVGFFVAGMPTNGLMLQCDDTIVAMQTKRLFVASGIRKLFPDHARSYSASSERGQTMSKTAPIALLPASSLFSRLMAFIDRLLIESSRIAVRNGDLPRFGL